MKRGGGAFISLYKGDINSGSYKFKITILFRIMMTHGGTYHHYYNSQKTTHIIASNLPGWLIIFRSVWISISLHRKISLIGRPIFMLTFIFYGCFFLFGRKLSSPFSIKKKRPRRKKTLKRFLNLFTFKIKFLW